MQVSIDSVAAGSVKVASTVAFLSGNSTSASTYGTALTSGNTGSIFGSGFGDVAVDIRSVTTATITNPSKEGCQPVAKRLQETDKAVTHAIVIIMK